MEISETVLEKLRALPLPAQKEVLDFIDFLTQQKHGAPSGMQRAIHAPACFRESRAINSSTESAFSAENPNAPATMMAPAIRHRRLASRSTAAAPAKTAATSCTPSRKRS